MTLPPDPRSQSPEDARADSRGRRSTPGGFTLLEVLVALAILGIGLGVILPGIGLGLRLRRDASDSVRLAVAAERLLGDLAQRTKAPATVEEGEEGGCRWSIEPLDIQVGGEVGPGGVIAKRRGPELVAVRVTVSAPGGPRWELDTLLPRGKPEAGP